MKMRKPPDPGSRKLVGFFQVPPDGASSEVEDAWMNSILDEMERVEKEEAAEKRQQAKIASQSRKEQHERRK